MKYRIRYWDEMLKDPNVFINKWGSLSHRYGNTTFVEGMRNLSGNLVKKRKGHRVGAYWVEPWMIESCKHRGVTILGDI